MLETATKMECMVLLENSAGCSACSRPQSAALGCQASKQAKLAQHCSPTSASEDQLLRPIDADASAQKALVGPLLDFKRATVSAHTQP